MDIKYYQENKYLNGDPYSIAVIEAKRKSYLNKAKEEQEKYHREIELYYQYISQIAEFLKDLNLNNSLEYSQALTYLLLNGFLSNDHTFNYQEAHNDLDSCFGMNIVEGLGVCRNIASFHNDVMKELNEESRRIYCYIEKHFKIGKYKPARHMMSEITYEGVKYGIDIGCNRLFRYKTPLQFEEIKRNKKKHIANKPYWEIVFDERTIDELKEELKALEEESKKKTISPTVYEEELLNKTFYYLSNKEDILEDFHNKTKIIRKEITNKSNTR